MLATHTLLAQLRLYYDNSRFVGISPLIFQASMPVFPQYLLLLLFTYYPVMAFIPAGTFLVSAD